MLLRRRLRELESADADRSGARSRAENRLPLNSCGAALARELFDSGKPDAAREVFDLMLSLAAGNDARAILFGLGRIQELAGRNPAAADYFLRSALLADAKAPDALTLQARFAAGINLARAGYKEDARAQFQWLLGNAIDPVQREAARRELSRLWMLALRRSIA